MGTWSTGIFGNDLSADIKSDFFEMYDDGQTIVRIKENILKDYSPDFKDSKSYEYTNCWLALAWCLWKVGQLDDDTAKVIKRLIEEGIDDAIWRQLGGSEKDCAKRQQVVAKLLLDISSENTSPKKPKRKIIYEPDYRVGDCVVIKTKSNNYLGIIIVSERTDNKLASNEFLLTDIFQNTLPTKRDYSNSNLLTSTILPDKNYSNKFNKYYMTLSLKTESRYRPELLGINRYEIVANIKIKTDNFRKLTMTNAIGQGFTPGVISENILENEVKAASTYKKTKFKKFFKIGWYSPKQAHV